ncbi:MAG: potassium channel family protein [Nitrospira sp.]
MKHKSFRENTLISPYRTMRERTRVLAELEDWLERPMQWLGLVWLVLVVVDLIGPPNRILEWLAGALWFVFLLDFLIRFTLAPRKSVYVRDNVFVAASLVVPALRMLRLTALMPALRAARGLKLARLVGGVNRTIFSLRSLTRGGGFQYVLLLTVAVILVGAAGIYAFENDIAGDHGIKDFGTALWWTSMIITTMGSDYWPRSPEGRILTFLLALYAFAIFGYVTATIARFLIGRDAGKATASTDQLLRLERELAQLRASLEQRNAGSRK